MATTHSGPGADKIVSSEMFDCKNLDAFVRSIVQVLPYAGASRSHFYNCEIDGVRFLTKMCFYHKSPPEVYGATSKRTLHQIDAEIGILRALKVAITDHNISPCILELVFHRVCSSAGTMSKSQSDCDWLILESPESIANSVQIAMCEHRDLVKAGLAHNKCAFLVLDRCDLSLGKFLAKGVNTPVSLAIFKSILFQIIFTIWAISRIFPRFRHNDLHTENIMLKFDTSYIFNASKPRFMQFSNGVKTFSVPYFGIIAKIIDFGHSILPEKNIMSNAIDDKQYMFHHIDNDLMLLFYWISTTLRRNAGDTLGRADAILSALEPGRMYEDLYPSYVQRNAGSIPTYNEMIDSPVWKEYLRAVPAEHVHMDFDAPKKTG